MILKYLYFALEFSFLCEICSITVVREAIIGFIHSNNSSRRYTGNYSLLPPIHVTPPYRSQCGENGSFTQIAEISCINC